MALNTNKLDSESFFDLVMDTFEDGDRKQTKWLLKKGAKKFPKHHLLPFMEGVLAVTVGDEVKGKKLFEKSLAIKPDFALAHANVSHCYQNLEKIPLCLYHAMLAVRYATEDEKELVSQQQDMLDMVEKEIPSELSLAQYVENGILFDQAFELMVDNEFEQAIELFEIVSEVDLAHSPALGNLGICHLLCENFAKSRDYLNKALRVDPSYGLAKGALLQLAKIESGELEMPKNILPLYHGQIERRLSLEE